jgi:hypothetical protein
MPRLYLMFLNRSSPPKLSDSSLSPNDLSSGSAGGGGPVGFGDCGVCGGGCACGVCGGSAEGIIDTGLEMWAPLSRGAGVELSLFSLPSGTLPMKELLRRPNQLVLFLRVSVCFWLLIVSAGELGRSSLRLSDDGRVRRPRNLRTDEGRRWVGDRLPMGCSGTGCSGCSSCSGFCGCSGCSDCSGCSGWTESVASESPVLRWGKTGDMGVGCEERGPWPAAGARGVAGGESRGAGIEVPSVREKLTGVNVSGLYFMAADVGTTSEESNGRAVEKRARAAAGSGDGGERRSTGTEEAGTGTNGNRVYATLTVLQTPVYAVQMRRSRLGTRRAARRRSGAVNGASVSRQDVVQRVFVAAEGMVE